MSNVRILLVEDDPSYALELEMIVDELGYELIATLDNAEDVFQTLKTEKPDLILMDIQIKGTVTGIEIAKRIDKENINVIFITNFNDKTIFAQANEIKHFGYIVKPFNHLTLESAIEVAIMNASNGKDDLDLKDDEIPEWSEDIVLKNHVFIKKRNRLDKIALDEIEHLQSDGNYCLIHTEKGKYILKMSLLKAADILSGNNFLRVNRSQIVNMKHITSIEFKENLINIGSSSFTIGERFKQNILKSIKLMK